MICPKCTHDNTKVLDSRDTKKGKAIRRRRRCEDCDYRFSTIEEVRVLDLYVEKRNGRVVPFDESRLEDGVRKSFNKRNINEDKIQKITQQALEEVLKVDKNPISSKKLGKIVLKTLKKNDEAAYICYWAMYGNFETAEDFNNLLKEIED